MRVLLQRVRRASVSVENHTVGQIDSGLLLLVGIAPDDDEARLRWMISKLLRLRLFDDAAGFMNRSLEEHGGAVLLVSQFTLYADTNKGARPGFSRAAPPAQARLLFSRFTELFHEALPGRVECGVFGADMLVSLENDGPVTLMLEK